MKQKLLALILIVVFSGCEPSYRVYIRNSSSSDLYIKTHPSIESLLYDTNSLHYDSIINHKLRQEDKYSVYKVKPSDSFLIFGGIGGGPTFNELPFDYIAFVSSSDTTILDSKEKIIEQAKRVDKKRNYYIEIRK